MEKLTHYRQAVRQMLISHSSGEGNNLESDVECQIVFDAEHDHYQLLDIGWEDMKANSNLKCNIPYWYGKAARQSEWI
jgi:XisI protein